ncbi:MAG: hypothetical protein R6V04_00535 [bacterium]
MDNTLKKITRSLIICTGKKIEKKHFSKPSIFIVACSRSGTTMLLSIFSAHLNEDYCQEMEDWLDHSQIKQSKDLNGRLQRLHIKAIGRP